MGDTLEERAVYCSGQTLFVLAVLSIFGFVLRSIPVSGESASFRNSLLFSSTGHLVDGHSEYLGLVTSPPPPPNFRL
jgi:hypothetical protein